MKLLLKMVCTFLWGFGLHQTAPLLNGLPVGWRELTSYGVGILGALPPGVWMSAEFSDIRDANARWAANFIALFFSMGAGVAFGYLFSTLLANMSSERNPPP